MNYLQQIKQWFNELSNQHKAGFVASFAFIIVMTSLLSWWTLSPTYAVLFSHMEEQDVNKILNQLEQEKIDYQLRNNGNDILIDKNLIAKTRLKMMSKNIQFTGSVGFELFDKSDFGMTDFSQKINYQRALQGELERTITSFEEVNQARVHLVIPENHLFDKAENQPKAAVTLHLKRRLTNRQVQSIQQLLTASIAHLIPKNVVIVDQNGNMLSSREEEHSSHHFKTKKALELYLNDKISQLLYKIYPDKQVMVKIDVAINYDELQRELIKPQTAGLITHEKEVKHTTSAKTDKDKHNQDITVEKSYQFGSEKELFKRANGTIERLTISVIVPQNTTPKTLEQLHRLIKSTVGFNEQRGDMINVEALIEATPVAKTRTGTPPVSEFHAHSIQAKQGSHLIALLSQDRSKTNKIIVCFIIIGFFISAATTFILKKIRQKKRQLLLTELTQWLSTHE